MCDLHHIWVQILHLTSSLKIVSLGGKHCVVTFSRGQGKGKVTATGMNLFVGHCNATFKKCVMEAFTVLQNFGAKEK